MPGVLAETVDGIGLVTFRFADRNACTAEAWDKFCGLLADWAEDPAVRAVVLTGAGHHAFITDPPAAAAEHQCPQDEAAARAQQALAAFPKPSIARIRGDCIGAGLMLALCADLIVAAEDSTYALPGARWGAAYPPEAVARLTLLVGPQQAKRMLFLGSRLAAHEALRIGLVTLLVADSDLSDIVADLAREVADNAPLAVAAAKRMVDEEGAALHHLVETCRASQDYAQGIAHRRGERLPAFRGH